MSSRRLADTDRSPTMVFISTGKKTIRAQISTLENSPFPSQIIKSGAMATTGMAWVATIYGASTRSTSRDLLRIYPRMAAVPTPSAIPATTSISV